MAQFFNLIGKTVTVVTDNEKLLPGFDEYLQSYIIQKLKSSGIEFVTGGKDQVNNKKNKSDRCNFNSNYFC